jgi:hypothetical protein
MTPNEQNKTIAEYCGWKHRDGGMWYNPGGSTVGEELMPNYHSDLNAMHKAELFMLSVDPILYKQVYLKTYMDCYFNGGVSAEASERAEAFLRTIGKWKE